VLTREGAVALGVDKDTYPSDAAGARAADATSRTSRFRPAAKTVNGARCSAAKCVAGIFKHSHRTCATKIRPTFRLVIRSPSQLTVERRLARE
jgi:hypothetical protein